MIGIYRSMSVCLLFVFGISGAGQESWEDLMRRSEELFDHGNFGEAETVLLSALKAVESAVPPNLRLAETQHRLGTVYRDLGKLPEAEKWYQRSLSTWKVSIREHGSGLPKPLISLASLYVENGLHGKASRLINPWLRDAEFKLDAADPLSISLLHNFAAVRHVQRRYSEADRLYRQALTAAETAFGPQSLEVAMLLNNLAILLAETGGSKEAGSHLERSMAIWEGALGPDHPDVARAVTNLAAFYCSTGAFVKAEPLFHRALAIAEGSLGPENRLVGKILSEYAALLRKTKRKKEAQLFETRAHAIREGHVHQDLGRHTIDVRDLLVSRSGSSGEDR